MKILDTSKRKRKEEIKEDLRKAIRHTLDNVDADEAWEALGESLQNAMGALGLGSPYDADDADDDEFGVMIMFADAAMKAMGKA